MAPSWLLGWFVGLFAVAVSLFRLVAARRNPTPAGRHLAGAVGALGLCVLLVTPHAADYARRHNLEPFPHAVRLAGSVLAMVAAWHVLLMLVHLAPGNPAGRARAVRRETAVLTGTATVTTALLLAVPGPSQALFHPRDPAAVAHLALWAAYLGWANTQYIRCVARWVHTTTRPWLRRGLWIVIAGAVLAVAWSLTRVGLGVTNAVTDLPALRAAEPRVAAVLSTTAILLVTVGSLLPTAAARTAAATRHLTHHLRYHRLTPLWTGLRPVIAVNALDVAAAGAVGIDHRLTARAVALRDALLHLSPHLPPPDPAPDRQGPRDQADRVAAALRAWHRGEPPRPTPTADHTPDDDLRDLLLLAAAWRRAHRTPRDTTDMTTAPTRRRPAKVITEVFAPWVIVLTLPPVIAWHATHRALPTLGWGLLVAATSSLLPMCVIIWGARTGRWDGHHVRDRAGRLVPFVALLTTCGAGLAALYLLDAPTSVISLNTAMLGVLIITAGITLAGRWKISMHAATAAGAVTILAMTISPVLLAGHMATAAVCWSRVALRDHTPAQVTTGAAVGTVIPVLTALI